MSHIPAYFVQDGDAVEFIAAADYTAGDIALIGSRPVLVAADVDYSENTLATGYFNGVWDVPQAAEIISAGARVYWDPTGNPVSGTAGTGAATGSATSYSLGIAAGRQPNGTAATAATDYRVRVVTGVGAPEPADSGTAETTFTVDSDSSTPKIALGAQAGGTGNYTLTIKPASTLTGNKTVTLPDATFTVGQRTTEKHTAGDTLTAAESGSHHSNTGASGTITIVLPAATVGLEFWFYVGAAQELRLDPNTTQTIALPSNGVQGGAGKYLVADAVGEYVRLICETAGEWLAFPYSGTWTAEG